MNLDYLYGKPKPKPPKTAKQRGRHAYYMRNRARLIARALASYYERKAA